MISKLKSLFQEDNCYSIGIRKRDNTKGLLFEGNDDLFKIIPISINSWYADPIVFSRAGKDYLFCEEYDRKKDYGFISVTELDSEKPQKPRKVLDIKTHLSYPCVFEMNDEVYMIPETTTKRTIEMYRAVQFPDQWEYHCQLKEGEEWADTTIYQNENYSLMLTFEQYQGNGSITRLKVWDAARLEDGIVNPFDSDTFTFSESSRAAGKVFEFSGGGDKTCTDMYS